MTARLEYIAPAKRRSMGKARRTRIFLRGNGKCYRCGVQLRSGDKWIVEHDEALNLGGADIDENCRVICIPCERKKTAHDRELIAKRNSIIDQGYVGAAKKKWRWPKRTFAQQWRA